MPRTRTISGARDRLTVFLFAGALLVLFVGLAFLAGWVLGNVLL
ncbi:MAG: hypothetical protein WCH31_05470 [Actinomycetes bacterium]